MRYGILNPANDKYGKFPVDFYYFNTITFYKNPSSSTGFTTITDGEAAIQQYTKYITEWKNTHVYNKNQWTQHQKDSHLKFRSNDYIYDINICNRGIKLCDRELKLIPTLQVVLIPITIQFNKQTKQREFKLKTAISMSKTCKSCGVYIPTNHYYVLDKNIYFCTFCMDRLTSKESELTVAFKKDYPELYDEYYNALFEHMLK